MTKLFVGDWHTMQIIVVSILICVFWYVYIYIMIYRAGSRFATVRFTTIHFYEACPVGLSTPDLWCITVATQSAFLYLVHF